MNDKAIVLHSSQDQSRVKERLKGRAAKRPLQDLGRTPGTTIGRRLMLRPTQTATNRLLLPHVNRPNGLLRLTAGTVGGTDVDQPRNVIESRITDLWTWPDVHPSASRNVLLGRKRNCSFSASSLPTIALSLPRHPAFPYSSRRPQSIAHRSACPREFHQAPLACSCDPAMATLNKLGTLLQRRIRLP